MFYIKLITIPLILFLILLTSDNFFDPDLPNADAVGMFYLIVAIAFGGICIFFFASIVISIYSAIKDFFSSRFRKSSKKTITQKKTTVSKRKSTTQKKSEVVKKQTLAQKKSSTTKKKTAAKKKPSTIKKKNSVKKMKKSTKEGWDAME